MNKNNKGSAIVGYLVAVAVIGLAAKFFAPSLFDKRTRDANKSAKATQELLVANEKKESDVAASVYVIGQANQDSPASKEKDFIGREVPLVLSKLSAPDPKKLIEAAERRAAIAEGKAELANSLYQTAHKDAEKLKKELDGAIRAREEMDVKLQEAAAYQLGAEKMKLLFIVGIVVLAGGIGYIYLNSISIGKVGKIAADIRGGVNPIDTIDKYVPDRLWSKVEKSAKLASNLQDLSSRKE